MNLKDRATVARNNRSLGLLRNLARECLDLTSSSGLKDGSRAALEAALHIFKKNAGEEPKFEWLDGPLIRAMRQGEWLLLDNANLCGPSVLDRLNSLCELNGSLVLTEKGIDQETILPHPDFRLIMTVDPYRGEISRAMRNRGIEIALDPLEKDNDLQHLLNARRLAPRPTSRPLEVFELSRRALAIESLLTPLNTNSFPVIRHRIREDTLSSKITVVDKLYNYCASVSEPAAAVFLLAYSGRSDAQAILRLLESFQSSRAASIRDLLRLALEYSCALRKLFVNIPAQEQVSGESERVSSTIFLGAVLTHPLQSFHPFMSSPYVDYVSEPDRARCMLASLITESVVLASNLEIHTKRFVCASEQQSEVQCKMPVGPVTSKHHDDLVRFIESLPKLVRKALLERSISDNDVRVRSQADSGISDYNSSPFNCQVLLELLHYAMYLHDAASRPIMDFSTLHVVSGWIFRSALAVTNILDGFEEQAKALHESYALSSGQKLCDIWKALFRPSLPPPRRTLLKNLSILPPGGAYVVTSHLSRSYSVPVSQKFAIDLLYLTSPTSQITAEMNEDLERLVDDLTKVGRKVTL